MIEMENPEGAARTKAEHAARLEAQAESLESRARGYDEESIRGGVSRHEADEWATLAGRARLDAAKFRDMAKDLRSAEKR